MRGASAPFSTSPSEPGLRGNDRPSPEVIGIVVLGTGSAGMRHLAALRGIEGVRPIAIAIHPERRGLAKAAGYAVAEDVAEGLRQGATRGIIATETGRHVKDGLCALALGLDLLVEKPLATTLEEASVLGRCAREQGREVFGGCTLRFCESLNTFRRLLGEVGAIHAVHIECRSYLPAWRPDRPYHDSYSARAGEGGVLLDLIHEIDYAAWLFGWPCAVQARLANLGRLGIAAEEIAELLWETPAGVSVTIGLDYLTRPARRGARVEGGHGTLEWDGVVGTVRLRLADGQDRLVPSSQTREAMFAAQARAFLQANGGRPDERLATLDDGLRALAVCDAARLASASGRQERVEYPEGLR